LPPVSPISRVLDLVTPYALRNPFGLVQHLLDRRAYLRVTLDRIGSFVAPTQHAFDRSLGASSRPLGASSSTKLDCIQDIGSLAFTALPPWSRPCGLTSDRALISDRTASSSLTTALRGFFHPSSEALPTRWKIVPCLSHDLRPTPADSAGRSIPAFQPIRPSKRQRGGRRGVPSFDEYLPGCK
jgi:hypothetical protein